MKTKDLTGPALDWAVAKIEGLIDSGSVVIYPYRTYDDYGSPIGFSPPRQVYYCNDYRPSTNWSQGGPIIEREGIELICNLTADEAARFENAHADWQAFYRQRRAVDQRSYASTPLIPDVATAEELIAYCARVSNPGNQANTETAPRLLAYLVRNQHWSPFEMVSVTMEVETTRDIARQMLRHRSFAFQEFSQRYATVFDEPVYRECRLQDHTNRQNSTDTTDEGQLREWRFDQRQCWDTAYSNYRHAISRGVAKEVARALLPEGLTVSRLYMAGTLRSWIHYVQLRVEAGTQKEHREIAAAAKAVLLAEFPSLSEVLA